MAFTHILIPTDFSEPATRALRYAPRGSNLPSRQRHAPPCPAGAHGSQKGVPIAGDVLVCDLWTLGIEDRVYVHRTDCHASSSSLRQTDASPGVHQYN